MISKNQFSVIKYNMNTYIFASLRGSDFIAYGETPEIAYQNLCDEERENGSLWKLFDVHRNQCAVNKQGFSYLDNDGDSVAYKQL